MNRIITILALITSIAYCRCGNIQLDDEAKPGYKFEYYVRDERTGDFKTQEERREGDYITGTYSVGEPNGDLRVVTYNADNKNGFNAHVQIQPGGSPLNSNSNIKEKEKHLEEIMKIIPKYQIRTGFPQLDIKVIPPKLHSSSKSKDTDEEIQDVKNKSDGIIKLEDKNETDVFKKGNTTKGNTKETTINKDALTSVINKNETTYVPKLDHIYNETGMVNTKLVNIQNENMTSSTKQIDTKTLLCSSLCNIHNERLSDAEEEGRAHIKPNEDKVQVEMEQIIRAEMQEPTGVNLGVPYRQQHTNINENDNKKFIIKPLNLDYKPLVNEEDVMKDVDGGQSATVKSDGIGVTNLPTPYLYERNIYMYPYNANNGWSKMTAADEKGRSSGSGLYRSIRYPDLGRALFTHSLSFSQSAKPTIYTQPLYTTGIAFIVLPRPF